MLGPLHGHPHLGVALCRHFSVGGLDVGVIACMHGRALPDGGERAGRGVGAQVETGCTHGQGQVRESRLARFLVLRFRAMP